MEAETPRPFESEAHISNYVQQQYLRQRRVQKQNGKKINITDDISRLMKFIGHSCGNPVVVLKSMGLLFFGKTAAFNLSVLPSQLVCCRNLALSALHDEGWEDVKENQDTDVGSIIGVNDAKNWIVMNIPPRCEVAQILADAPALIARESSFGLDRTPNELLIGPNMPPPEVLTEPHFPLVSIQYEQVLEKWEIADLRGLESAVKRRDMKIVHCGSVDIEYDL